MPPALLDYALVAGYALLIGVVAVQYRQGRLRSPRLQLVLGMCLTWLAYGLFRLSAASPLPSAEPLRLVIDALAVGCFAAGVGAIYWWWRDGSEAAAN